LVATYGIMPINPSMASNTFVPSSAEVSKYGKTKLSLAHLFATSYSIYLSEVLSTLLPMRIKGKFFGSVISAYFTNLSFHLSRAWKVSFLVKSKHKAQQSPSL